MGGTHEYQEEQDDDGGGGGGKGSRGEWKINEERMEDVEVFKYLGVWFDIGMRGNVHLKMREKAEKWVIELAV